MNPAPAALPPALPEHLAQAVWRGDALGQARTVVVASGHAALDAELPGGGWPCQAMTEVLQAQAAQAEWRLLSPALAQVVRQGGSVLLIGPPQRPHLPGLWREGLRDDRLVCVDAHTPAERLWATEQALKARCVSAVLSWLPQARAEQIRRLHVCAARHPGLLFVFRPVQALSDSSAAPLRVLLGLGPCPHPLHIEIVKRRGPALGRPLCLPSWPRGLAAILPTKQSCAPPLASMPESLRPSVPADQPPHHVALDRPAARGAAPAFIPS